MGMRRRPPTTVNTWIARPLAFDGSVSMPADAPPAPDPADMSTNQAFLDSLAQANAMMGSEPAPVENPVSVVDPAAPKVAPYERHLKESLDKGNFQRKLDRNQNYSGEEFARLKRQKMGITSPQKIDAQGNPVFQKKLVTDEMGQPVLDESGAPVFMNGDPVYDESQQIIDPNDPYQMASRGIEEQQRSIRDLLESAQPQLDISPLRDLIASQTNDPNFGKSYRSPAKFSDTLEKAMNARKSIITDQANLNKEANDVKDLKAGSTQDLASQLLQSRLLNEAGFKAENPNNMMERTDANLAWRGHTKIVDEIKKNKPLVNMLGTYRTLGNALSIIQHNEGPIPQQIHEFQSLIRQAIGGGVGGSFKSTGNEREQAVAKTLDWNLSDLQQFLNNKPGNTQKDAELLVHLQKVAGTEQQNLRHQMDATRLKLTKGYDYLYNPEDPNYDEEKYGKYRRSMENLLDAASAEVDPIGASPTPGGKAMIERRIVAPNKKAAVAERKENRAAETKKNGPTPRQKEIEQLKKDLGM